MGRWLRYWLKTRTSIRPSTLRSYTEHVERHLIPYLGRVRLGELTGRQVADMFHRLGSTNNRYGRPPTPATLHRIRATLRGTLNAAIRNGLLRDNPARHIELPSPRRPHAEVWTDHRVKAWRETGERFPVAVWTVQQLVAFFAFVAGDRLYALWWLIALRGLRRGEAAGLRWANVDLDGRVIVIGQQRIAYGHTVAVGPPKTASSRRVIALDKVTARLLRTHLRRQRTERHVAGELAGMTPGFSNGRPRTGVMERRTSMVKIHGEAVISRPVEDVFDFVADERNEPKYNPRMIRAEKVTPGPVGRGTRWVATIEARGHPLDMAIEVTDYHRPDRLGSTTHMSTAEIHGAVTFEPDPAGTRMRWSWHLQPKGVFKLLTPVIGRMGRRQEEQIWAGLKRYLENTQPQTQNEL